MEPSAIIERLLARDNDITRKFFFGDEPWSVRRNLVKILYGVYHAMPDYDDAVSELYAHLLAGDGRNLRSFDPSKCSFYYWFKIVAIRFFVKKRDGVSDNRASATIEEDEGSEHVIEAARIRKTAVRSEGEATERETVRQEAKADVQRILFRMPNQRYKALLHKLLVLDMDPAELAEEWGTTVGNIYTLRKRANEQFEQILAKDIKQYANQRHY